jgi:hypothetical protein
MSHRSHKNWVIYVVALAITLALSACADATSGSLNGEGLEDIDLAGGTSDASDAGSDARTDTTSGSDGTSGADSGDTSGGDPAFALCVLGDQPPSGECLDTTTLDFGLIGAQVQVTRRFHIENTGDAALDILNVRFDTAAAGMTLRTYRVEPPAGGGASVESDQALPVPRDPTQRLFVDVTYTGLNAAGPLPASKVIAEIDVGLTEFRTLEVNLTGESSGCPSGLADCDPSVPGCETPIDSNVDNCGGCGQTCEAPNSVMACVDRACESVSCADGYQDCDPAAPGCETHSAADLSNCGGCGQTCDLPNTSEECVGGVCTPIGSCDTGFRACGTDIGCGTDIFTDPNNCGDCGVRCELSNALGVCNNGACVFSCGDGFRDCNSDLALPNSDGCEINVDANINNCGACGEVCDPANGSARCEFATCIIESCASGFEDCDRAYDNGCETNIVNGDAENCNGCGATFPAGGAPNNGFICPSYPNASRLCVDRTCQAGACGDDYQDCTSAAGCETNVTNNINHCGACGVVCAPSRGTGQCVDSQCDIAGCNAGYADCNESFTDGCEVNTLSGDPNNCGGCASGPSGNPGYACPFYPNAARVCASGGCQMGACDAGFADCNGNTFDGCETDLSTVNNCGGCASGPSGNPARNCLTTIPNAAVACNSGICQLTACDTGFADCTAAPGCETNTTNSGAHCGGCGTACLPSQATGVCAASSCQVSSCNAGYGDCNGTYADGCEVNTAGGNPNNCGGCSNFNAAFSCPTYPNAARLCVASTCQMGSCASGFSDCNVNPADGCEVNTTNTVTSCGACGTNCGVLHPNRGVNCAASACVPGTCNSGYGDCTGAPGCETDTTSSTTHCGACGNSCAPAQGTGVCVSSACQINTCNAGYGNCNNLYADGCETNTTSGDPNNCGGCNLANPGFSCPNYPNAARQCVASTCQMGSCSAGYANCNGTTPDGCEVNTNTDTRNCGGCGAANPIYDCVAQNPGYSVTCNNGTCVRGTCGAGTADCTAAPGCETNTTTSNTHCGVCGNACAAFQGSAACASSSCQITGCNTGYGDCNNLYADGCETNTTNTVAHCGGCGSACPGYPNAASLCVSSTCQMGSCNAGFGDCTAAAGCETNLTNTVNNCGACGTDCGALHPNRAVSCSASACAPGACFSGYGDCTGAPGCETNTTNTIAHCGACGNNCATRFPNSNTSCSSSACTWLSCQANYYNLDTTNPPPIDGNGCEYFCTGSPGNTDLPETTASGPFTDQNCDGIDGDISRAIFVSLSGRPAGAGTKADPVNNIQTGINLATAQNKHVYVAAGTYFTSDTITLSNGVGIYGGYSPSDWSRSNSNVVTINYAGTTNGSRIIGLQGTSLTSTSTVLDRVTVVTPNATGSNGTSNYGLHCVSCTGLRMSNDTITAGNASSGVSGVNGTGGANGGTGGGGSPGECDDNGVTGWGGTGGSSPCGSTGGGGGGGQGGGAPGCNNGANGGTGVGPGGGGGAGGGCSSRTICWTGCCGPSTADGGAVGTVGGTGTNGANGAAGTGTVSGNFWTITNGIGGGNGTAGGGGGGGGGGGSQSGSIGCIDDGPGNGGGGGGGGGCGGTLGSGGSSGGGSFGLFLVNSTGSLLTGNTIRSGAGGAGGNGGTGGGGGTGGNGGAGATTCTSQVGGGGNGARGGNGGVGGHGGGGAGGPSYAIYRVGTTISTPGNTLTAGAAGAGGSSSGNPGANGASGQVN